MRLKRATARAGPLLQEQDAGARARAARRLLRGRSWTGVPCCSNSSNRWCASSGLSVPARARSVAAAKAAWGDQEREGREGEVVVEERRRRMRDTGVVVE
jgi:hypothetical protein